MLRMAAMRQVVGFTRHHERRPHPSIPAGAADDFVATVGDGDVL